MCTLKHTTLFLKSVQLVNHGTWRSRPVWKCTCSFRLFFKFLHVLSTCSVYHSKHLRRATDGKGALLCLCLLDHHLLLVRPLGDAGQVQSQDSVRVYATHDLGISFDHLREHSVAIDDSILLRHFFSIALLTQLDAWLAFPHSQTKAEKSLINHKYGKFVSMCFIVYQGTVHKWNDFF